MGLSNMPTPSEGMLTLLLVNTALSVSILKDVLRSLLHLLRLRSPAPLPPSPSFETSPSPDAFPDESPEPTITDRFRTRFKPVRFGSAFCHRKRRTADRSHADCRVCLARFEPESVVNRLPCGHLFHKACLETWLDYHHATCPLCRSHVLQVLGTTHDFASTSSPRS